MTSRPPQVLNPEHPKMNAVAQRDEPAAVIPADAGSIMAVISRAAADPSTDVDKLERLLGMYERITARSAETAFNEAMRAAQAEMPQILRDKKNEQTGSWYAKLETISKAMTPVVTKHGFSLSFGSEDCPLPGHYRVTCVASHIGGHSRTYHVDVPSDGVGIKGNQNKTATHAFGSTMSYGKRYLKTLIFDVATTDDDDGRAAGGAGFASVEQTEQIKKLLKETGAHEGAFLNYLGAESVDTIPAAKFQAALAALNAKKRKTANG